LSPVHETSASRAKGGILLANIATGSLIVALFSGSCAFGVGKGLSRFTRPLAYGALALAIVLYAVGAISS
jgi:hypothetical protein